MLKMKLNAYQIAEAAEDNLDLRFFDWYEWYGDVTFSLNDDAKNAPIEKVRKEAEKLLFFVYSQADNVEHYIFNSDATLFVDNNIIDIETFKDCYDDFIMERF